MPPIEVKSNKTFTDLYGDHINNLVVFGDDSRPDKFYAHIKMEFWGENWVTFEDKTASGPPVLDKEKIALNLSDKKIEWHQHRRITGVDTFSSSLKWLITLKENPASNKYEFELGGQWRDFDFVYNPPLIEVYGEAEEYTGPDGEEWVQTTQPHGIDLHVLRRLKVDGSYTVNHKIKANHCLGGKNYRTGKVLQIYRPKATDIAGKSVWCDLRIENGLYQVTIPQKFLDSAVYPVLVNDEFGYHTIGDTTGAISKGYVISSPSGSPASDGQITHITYYLGHQATQGQQTYGLYNSSAGVPTSQSLVVDTGEGTPSSDYAWYELAVDSQENIYAASTYWISQNHNDTGSVCYYYWDPGTTRYYYSSAYSAGTLPATFSASPSTTADRKYSAFVTFTPSGVSIPLAGISSSTVTAIGDLAVSTNLVGSSLSAITTSGDLDVITELAGAISASVTTSGSIVGGTNLAGTVLTFVTIIGNTQILTELQGQSSSSSSTSGIAGIIASLSGLSSSGQIISGDLSIATQLQGTVPTSAIPTGGLQILISLSGVIAAVVTTEAELFTEDVIPLAGDISVTATLLGDLQVEFELVGTTFASATIEGDVKIQTPLSGSILVLTTTSGAVDSQPGLVGTSQSTVTTLGNINVDTTLVGTTFSTVISVGNVEVETVLAGSVTATVTTIGSMEGPVPLAGTISASSISVGVLSVEATLAGIITGAIISDGTLSIGTSLAGTIIVTVVTVGQIGKSLLGVIESNITIEGDLEVIPGLQGVVSVIVTTTGDLYTVYYGHIQAEATLEGNITRTLSLSGESSCISFAEGEISGAHIFFSGYTFGLASLTGTLGAKRGILMLNWIPTDVEGSANLLGWVWPNVASRNLSELTGTEILVTRVAGLSLFETARIVHEPVSFRTDWYYRIHVYTKPINLGAIVGDTSVYVVVWNAFFENKILDGIDKTGSTFQVTGQDPTFTYIPLWYEEYDLAIPGSGPFTFSAEVDFTFGATDTLPVIISGTRVALLYWRPQTRIKETLLNKTDVLKSSDGTEQRIKIRPIPRQKFKLKLLFEDVRNSNLYDMLLHRWQKRTWAIPIWSEYENHSIDILSADTIILVDTTNADFRADSFALIWKSNIEFAIVNIDTITDSQLNLSVPVGVSISGAKIVLPLRLANMISQSMKRQYETGVTEVDADFLVIDNTNITGYSADQTYDGLEVLTIPSAIDPYQGENHFLDVFITDFDTGIVEVLSYSEFNDVSQTHIWYNNNREACWKFRQFLHDKHGRQVPFLVPTFRKDLDLVQNIGPSDTYIRVQNIGMASNMGLNDLRTYVAFIVSGVLHVRKIVNIIEIDSSIERFDIDTSLGLSISMGDEHICFVDKVRFGSDEVDIVWERTGYNKCQTGLIRVK